MARTTPHLLRVIPARRPPDLMAALDASLTPTRIEQRLARLCPDPAHGGYPGDVIVFETYLACTGCGRGDVPLDEPDLTCWWCDGELVERRVHPAPEPTKPLFTDTAGISYARTEGLLLHG